MKTLTLMQDPECGEDETVSLLEEQRHSITTNQRDSVPALGDRHVALLWEDVLQVRLNVGGTDGENAVFSPLMDVHTYFALQVNWVARRFSAVRSSLPSWRGQGKHTRKLSCIQ